MKNENLNPPNKLWDKNDGNYQIDVERSGCFCATCFDNGNKEARRRQYEREYSSTSKTSSTQRSSPDSSDMEWQDRKGMCGPFSWSILPVLLSITASIGFVMTYLFAKSNCHIEKWILPYLSYTGTEYPESMLFGMILNTGGFIGLIVVFLAWRYYRHMGQLGCLNQVTLVLGLLSCFGVVLVGNFQVTKAKVPHYIGAGLAFIVGTGYCVMTSVLSRRALRQAYPPLKYSSCFSTLRCVVAIVMVLALTCLSGVGMYKKLSERQKLKGPAIELPLTYPNGSCREMLNNVPPFVQYIDLLGSLTEWLLTACLLVCLSLFAFEFKTFRNVKVVLMRRGEPIRCHDNHRGDRMRQQSKSSCHTLLPPPTPQPEEMIGYGKQVYGRNSSRISPPPLFTSRQDAGDSLLPGSGGSLLKVRADSQAHNISPDSGIEDNLIHGDSASSSSILLPEARLVHSKSLPILNVETV